MNINHGNLYHVCCRTLYGGINGVSLSKAPVYLILRINISQIPAATHNGFNIFGLAGFIDGIIHKGFNLRKLNPVGINYVFGFTSRNPQALR